MATPIAKSHHLDNSAEQQASTDVIKLIRKLRWIGMEEEAQQLQVLLNRFPSERRATVLDLPNTD